MKWLGSHLQDNQFVACTFVLLCIVNAFAMAYGYYG